MRRMITWNYDLLGEDEKVSSASESSQAGSCRSRRIGRVDESSKFVFATEASQTS
jgi:hypothetical protein